MQSLGCFVFRLLIRSSCYLSIHSTNKHKAGTYYVPSTVLETKWGEKMTVSKLKKQLRGERTSKKIHNKCKAVFATLTRQRGSVVP